MTMAGTVYVAIRGWGITEICPAFKVEYRKSLIKTWKIVERHWWEYSHFLRYEEVVGALNRIDACFRIGDYSEYDEVVQNFQIRALSSLFFSGQSSNDLI